jgi:ABC-type lipoprotein export system ATPase subunit
MNNLYEIENLECKYPKNKRSVLEIEKLDIENNKIVFFIGASGVGKSTILETLGLMNNTIQASPNTKFVFNNEGVTDITKIWAKGEKALSEFRRKHLSFIFQQTNLFPHLTVHQNANIIQIIQGKKYLESDEMSNKIFAKLGLDFNSNAAPSPFVNNISGGQRQRVAFARAITANFSVLFADEPTGNLDFVTADTLMHILKTNLEEGKRTAVIVSHDISLALKFADKIVLIDKRYDNEFKQYYGVINDQQVFYKNINTNNWTNQNMEYNTLDLENHLRNEMSKQSQYNKI